MTDNDRIGYALFSLRVGVFVVMFIWTLDKILNPEHALKVYEKFYYIPADVAAPLMMFIAVAEMVIILAFLGGLKKRITYGLVLLFHGVSTFSSWKMYIEPFSNMLFWAAWPMLAACFALYILRDMDSKFTVCSLCAKWCKKD